MIVINKKTLDLIPYAKNSRTHSEHQISQIAASISEYGFTNPVLIDENNTIIAGHGRIMAAVKLAMMDVPCVVLHGLTELQKKAYVIADNQLALNAGWDMDILKGEVDHLIEGNFDIENLGFDDSFLDDLLIDDSVENVDGDEPPDDVVPAVTPDNVVSRLGDIWLLGSHRVMCGDSTSPVDVGKLTYGKQAALLHADPPYGMGKEADGVQNDNIYGEKLDEFQMLWWHAWRPFLFDNASAYIWGNAPDLWRLWYSGGLRDSELLELRNEIVWSKTNVPGMASHLMTQYPEASERCLFVQFGKQFLGSVNSDQYWTGWDKIRGYLENEAGGAGLTASSCHEITGVQMYSHWFTKSQWSMMNEKYYTLLNGAFPSHFQRPYSELRAIYDKLNGDFRDYVGGLHKGMRAYFDNTHDNMIDVWDFPRVFGEERHGHATPKPVEMMMRVMRSSLPRDGLCLEPFGGSGSTLVGAEKTGRVCYTMELTPAYVDVIVKRWQKLTGKKAVLQSTGQLFNG